MTGGRRDQLITIQRATVTRDSYGEEVSSWGILDTEWGAVYYGRGEERRRAAQEEGAQSAVIQVLSHPGTQSIVITDRIILLGRAWDLVGISPDTPSRGLIEFTVTATNEAVTP
jgi:head-tail adaptor